MAFVSTSLQPTMKLSHLQPTMRHSHLQPTMRHSHLCPAQFSPPPPPGSCMQPGSGPACVHYSFDFAQQVHYPHNPLQPGPMYFKTVRKCAIFVVCCEGLPHQINILLMRRLTLVRERTLWLVWYTTSLHTTLWGRHAYIYMQITVLGRIKTIPFSSTVRGGFCLVSTSQSPCHSCSLGTRSSRLTGALACSSSGSGELSSAVSKTWLMLSIHLQM